MRKAGERPAAAGALPRALVSPHLDPRREGHVSARAYLEIGESEPSARPEAGALPPVRVVVFGTGHGLAGDFVALTRKRFETPLGQAPCDTTFVDRVASRLGSEAYRRELVHRDEHSIEFQVIYLQRRFGKRPFTIVPILCGGFDRLLDEQRTPRDEPVVESLIEGVREAERAL